MGCFGIFVVTIMKLNYSPLIDNQLNCGCLFETNHSRHINRVVWALQRKQEKSAPTLPISQHASYNTQKAEPKLSDC
jgi:hypothetical protein